MKDSVHSPLPMTEERERDPDHNLPDMMDAGANALLGRLTGGLAPSALTMAWMDWAMHYAASPGKQGELAVLAADQVGKYVNFLTGCAFGEHTDRCVQPDATDRRFAHPGWQRRPFNAYEQAFLMVQDWWKAATTDVRGMSPRNERIVSFAARQVLDAMSPGNFPATNPEVLEKTAQTHGRNLLNGWANWVQDARRQVLHRQDEARDGFEVGRDLAVTPGKVVFRNDLIELIQYAPATETVRPEPVLIVPAWIMKYYILDLSPRNSMVKYLTEQGFTVFMISWRNPESDQAGLGMSDYLELGPMAALDVVCDLSGSDKVHAAGYCLGGTLLSIAAATMARDGDTRLASLSLLAAQMDFSEAGELTLFINDAQVAFLEDMMWNAGYLSAEQMSGAFQILRSNDLVWSRLQHEYMMGEQPRPNDLMAWNADSTRMPYRMHSQYLRQLYLDNAFASNRYQVGGQPVTPGDIRVPIFAVGTETDHVAPWKSAYKVAPLTRSDVTFVLTNGGHNAGVVSEPGHPHRHYHVRTSRDEERYVAPERWLELAELREGSWWPEWAAWLAGQSGPGVTPPRPRRSLGDAPGSYVLMP